MITVIEKQKGIKSLKLKEVWTQRNLIKALVSRDFKSRFRKTALGPLWFFLNPFITMLLSTFVFGRVAKIDSDGLPYAVFYFAGMLPWELFQKTMLRTSGSLRDHMSWLTKVYFPKLIAPIVSFISGMLEWSFSMLILIMLLFYYRVEIKSTILILPLYIFIVFLTSVSIGLLTAAITIRFRDVSNVMVFLATAWYYVTPVIYSANLIPSKLVWIYKANPMYWVVEGFRWALLGTGTPPQLGLLYPTMFFAFLFVISLFVFSKASRSIVDVR
jgi:homopolymeric O-antigen transport system permease protein